MRECVAVWLLLLGAIATASAQVASAQVASPTSACAACTLSLTRTATLDDPAATLRGFPQLVSATRAGQLIVTEKANAAPIVFDSTGAYVGRLGREGRGPGELSFASWIDGEIDDSVRVVDIDRIVVFDGALRPRRTVVGSTPMFVWSAAFLRPAAYVSQTSVQDSRDPTRTVSLIVRSDSGRVLAQIEIPKLNGQKTFVRLARKLDDSRAFWMTETVVKGLQGYRVVAMSDAGVRTLVFRQQRAWWVSADFDREPLAALSRVQFIRQLDAGHLAVMIAQPIKDWRRVSVTANDMRNDRERYETLIEVLDTRTGALLGSATTPGFPISLLSEQRAAVYRESPDGTPRIEIMRLSLESRSP